MEKSVGVVPFCNKFDRFPYLTEAECHIYASVKETLIGSTNGLSPLKRQTIIWTNASLLSFRTLGINGNEILIEIQAFSFKKMHLKRSSGKWRPFCLGFHVLIRVIAKVRLLECWGPWLAIYNKKIINMQWSVRFYVSFFFHMIHCPALNEPHYSPTKSTSYNKKSIHRP